MICGESDSKETMHFKTGLFICLLSVCQKVCSQNATIPGSVCTPYPTVVNIAIQWFFTGDDNRNGLVTVRYRTSTESQWHPAQPLRLTPADSNEGFSWTSSHSGSIVNLVPKTSYEIELTLTDPDGGSTVRTVTAATRPVPRAFSGGALLKAGPATFTSVAASAQAGDIILLDSGNYGDYTAVKDGQEGRPIVFRSASAPKAVFSKFDLQNRSYIFLEGLAIAGLDQYGIVRMRGTTGCVVRRCKITATGMPGSGITAYAPKGAALAYIADNEVIRSAVWEDAAVGANGNNEGEGIQITGPGNVICHNKVKGFRDCISFFEDAGADNQVCIDVYNNDIELGLDDGVEADFAMGNCRIMRNRLTNCFVGMSSQPSLGGPTYFIRNVMYNIIYSPFKLHRGSRGDVAFHNTVVKCGDAMACYAGVTWSRTLACNNLFIGGTGGGTYGGYSNGTGRVADLQDADVSCVFNYDGYGSVGTSTFTGKIGKTAFSSLQQMQTLTTEKNAVQVDLSVFIATIAFPSSGPYPERPVTDLRIKSGSAGMDGGCVLANINDGFKGTAPDIGAYESGDSLPIYGPRPEGVDEETVCIGKKISSGFGVNKNSPFFLNQVHDKIQILFRQGENEKPVSVEMFDPGGKCLFRSGTQVSKKLCIPTRSLHSGIYVIKVRFASGRVVYVRGVGVDGVGPN